MDIADLSMDNKPLKLALDLFDNSFLNQIKQPPGLSLGPEDILIGFQCSANSLNNDLNFLEKRLCHDD